LAYLFSCKGYVVVFSFSPGEPGLEVHMGKFLCESRTKFISSPIYMKAPSPYRGEEAKWCANGIETSPGIFH